MTISSVLVGLTTVDQRQNPSAEGTTPATSDSASALQAGPWSAIDWEFGSVLRALIPEGKDEPLKAAGPTGEQADASDAPVAEAPAPQTLSSLPKIYPATFTLALDRNIVPPVVVEEPVALDVRADVAVDDAPTFHVDDPPREIRVDTPANNPKIIAFPAEKNTPEREVVRTIPTRTFDLAPKLRLTQTNNPDSSPITVATNTLEAEVVGPTAARTFSLVPLLPVSLPPIEIRAESRSTVPVDSGIPVSANTLDAEVVSLPAAPTSDIVPSLAPSSLAFPKADIPVKLDAPAVRISDRVPVLPSRAPSDDTRVAPQPRNPESSAISVKATPPAREAVNTAAIEFPDMVPAPSLKAPAASKSESQAPTDVPEFKSAAIDVPVQSRRPISIDESVQEAPLFQKLVAPKPHGARKLAEGTPPQESAVAPTPEKKLVTEPTPLRVVPARPTENIERIAIDPPAKPVASEPLVTPKPPVAVSPGITTIAAPTPIETPKAPATAERTQTAERQIPRKAISITTSPSVADSAETLVPASTPILVQALPIQASTIKPVEMTDKKSVESGPKSATASEDQPPLAVASNESKTEYKEEPASNATAPILQSAIAPAVPSSPGDPERRTDDRPKTHATGVIAVSESKPEPTPAAQTPDLPASTANRKSADLGQILVAESKTKADQPLATDTEVAFTGRLVPRKVVEESTSRPEPARPFERLTQPESVDAKPVHETPEPSVEHPVRPIGEHRAEPGIVVSPVHRDTAPTAANRPAEAAPALRTANNEIVPEPVVTREAPGPVREISMRFNDPSQESAHLRVVDKGGEVLVSVRSGSEQLARTLSSDLGDLAHRLEQTGFQAELLRPTAQSSSSEPGHDRRDNSSTADQNGSQSWSRERRDSQQHSGQKSHEWIDDLEESMGLSQ